MTESYEGDSLQSDVDLKWPDTPKMPSLERRDISRRGLWSCGPSVTLTTEPNVISSTSGANLGYKIGV